MIKMNQLRARYRLFNSYEDYFKRVSFLNTSFNTEDLNITFTKFKKSLLNAGLMDEYMKVISEDNMPFFGFEVEKMWEKHVINIRESSVNAYLNQNSQNGGEAMNPFDMEYFLATRFETKKKLKIVDIGTKLIHELN